MLSLELFYISRANINRLFFRLRCLKIGDFWSTLAKWKQALFILFFFSTCALSYEAPVSDISQSGQSTVNLSPREEIEKLKRQLSYLLEMNFPAKIEALQQEIQTLRGVVEKQNHDIVALQEGLKTPSSLQSPLIEKSEPNTLSDYERAIEAIRNKKYSEAKDLLVQYLAAHPKDKLAGNAHFWLGEVYYQLNKKYLARREFEIVRKQHSSNAKAPNALLKIGYIEIDDENFGKAKEIFREIIKTFPGTPSAHLAKIKLDKLNLK